MADRVSGAGSFERPARTTPVASAGAPPRRPPVAGLLPSDVEAELALAEQSARRRHPSAGRASTRVRLPGPVAATPGGRRPTARRLRPAT